jgi:hypothetical protein
MVHELVVVRLTIHDFVWAFCADDTEQAELDKRWCMSNPRIYVCFVLVLHPKVLSIRDGENTSVREKVTAIVAEQAGCPGLEVVEKGMSGLGTNIAKRSTLFQVPGLRADVVRDRNRCQGVEGKTWTFAAVQVEAEGEVNAQVVSA